MAEMTIGELPKLAGNSANVPARLASFTNKPPLRLISQPLHSHNHHSSMISFFIFLANERKHIPAIN